MQHRVNRPIRILVGAIGVGLMMTFVIGLSLSISQGFAGVMGGLPFTIIVTFVICMAVYDYWEENVKKGK